MKEEVLEALQVIEDYAASEFRKGNYEFVNQFGVVSIDHDSAMLNTDGCGNVVVTVRFEDKELAEELSKLAFDAIIKQKEDELEELKAGRK
jgi:hypothetical protein